jgi:hypothetical protein
MKYNLTVAYLDTDGSKTQKFFTNQTITEVEALFATFHTQEKLILLNISSVGAVQAAQAAARQQQNG